MGQILLTVFAAFLTLAPVNAYALSFNVDALANSSTGGTGLDTGIDLLAGENFTVTVGPDDLWSAGALPRWSNADGLVAPLYATGSDESGQAAGTLIGKSWSYLWSQSGFSAPFGSLVGEISGTFFLIGTSFSGPAPATGTLKFYYWDSNNGDNIGRVTADVRVSAVPEPGTFLLLGSGLIVLAVFARRVDQGRLRATVRKLTFKESHSL